MPSAVSERLALFPRAPFQTNTGPHITVSGDLVLHTGSRGHGMEDGPSGDADVDADHHVYQKNQANGRSSTSNISVPFDPEMSQAASSLWNP